MREKRGSNNRGSCNTQEQTAFRPLFHRRRGIFSRRGAGGYWVGAGGGGFSNRPIGWEEWVSCIITTALHRCFLWKTGSQISTGQLGNSPGFLVFLEPFLESKLAKIKDFSS